MNPPLESAEPSSAQQKRLLLAQMLQRKASRPQDRPLSFGQERLWLLSQLSPDVPVYNIAVAYRLTGELDVPALEQSIAGIARRHEILRTTFPTVKGRLEQRVSPDATAPLVPIDLRDLAPRERAARVRQLASEEAATPFDLGRGPLWRVTLLRCSDQEHVLLLTMHHIVSDGWSFLLFCQELSALYAAHRAGRPSPLPALPLQYADFAQRQRQLLSGPFLDEQLAYWREHLAGDIPTLQLPTDRPAVLGVSPRGARQSLALSPELSQALNDLSQRENATPFMTMLAAFQALLYQFTRQEDMTLCTPMVGRHRSQSRSLIGYFNNLLPLRCDLRGDPSLIELVRRARQVSLNAYKYQDLPFSLIIDAPHLRHVSLNRVLFSLDMAWPPELSLVGLTIQAEDLDTGTSDFDLGVSIWEQEGRFLGTIKYKTDLFDDDTIRGLIAQYQSVLETLITEPERALASLPQLGKPSVAARAGTNHRTAPRYEPPRTPTELRVTKEWEEVLGIQPIGVFDDLLALGASSLTIAQLWERLQRTFDIDLPLSAMFQARSVEQFVALLEARGAPLPSTPLAALRPQGGKPPLFLCEGVGIYYPMIRYLGEDQPVYGLFTEHRNDFPRVEDLAARYVQAVQTIQPEGPYYLGGASFGGLVAFEMAQQLYAQGQQVALLVLFDTPAPGASTPKTWPRRWLGHLSNWRRFGQPYLQRKSRDLRKKLRRWSRLLAQRWLNGSAPSPPPAAPIAHGAEVRLLFNAGAARYEVKPYPGPITLFALGHRDGMSDSLFDPALDEIDPQLGWGRVALGGLEVHELSGEHMTILKEPHVQTLGQTLHRCLETAQAALNTSASATR
jgi:thioesterase domain-containing protein/acyl carrier protein